MWIDGYTNTDFIDAPAAPLINPPPVSVWQIDPEVDLGYPFISLFIDSVRLHITPYKQRPYICVYAKDTAKADFASNGLAILTPTSCEVTDTLNGMRSVQLVHPIDPEKRYELLIINNILKVNGQLYTIKMVDTQYIGAAGTVTVYAEHIWYQMNDGWIFPPTYLYGTSGQAALENILDKIDYQAREGAFIYAFQGESDITMTIPFRRDIDDGCTPIDAMLGSGGFVEKLGGELYRDNFYFSINERMEDANDNAFDIRIGKNLTGVKRTVDTTTMATYFRAYDAWGGWWAVAWDFEDFLGDLFPHYVVRSQNFSKPSNADQPSFDYDVYFNQILIPEGMAYFKANCKPIIRYEITIEDVRQNPDFEMISAETLRVGDKGTLYDKRLGGTLGIEITETVYDAIRCKVTQVIVGDRQSFVSTASPLLVVDVTPEPLASAGWLHDNSGGGLIDKDGNKLMRMVQYGE